MPKCQRCIIRKKIWDQWWVFSYKKNPLVLPPDFNALPEPEEQDILTRQETIESEIDDIVSSMKSDELSLDKVESLSESSSTEEFVLDQIKK